jgi:predicted Zn finger-like uncharacterized protein
MEVTCGRCKANYEFDDALLSAEGTTVRCTRCGYEFDVFPREELADEWSVWLSGASEPLKYDALADLERDIIAGKIGPDDRLAKGGEEPRRLSSISELGPLLRQHALSRVPPPRDLDRSLTRTRLGLPALGDKLPSGLLAEDRPSPPPAGRPHRSSDTSKRVRSALSGTYPGTRPLPESSPRTLSSGTPPALSGRARPPLLSQTLPSAVPLSESAPATSTSGLTSSAPGSSKVPSSYPTRVPPSPRVPRDFGLATATDGTRVPAALAELPPLRVARESKEDTRAPARAVSTGAIRSAPQSLPRKRGARAALLVVLVFGGALVFGLTVGRESFQRRLASAGFAPSPSASEGSVGPEADAPSPQATLAQAHRDVRSLDLLWFRTRWMPADDPKREGLERELFERLGSLEKVLPSAPASKERIWDEIDVLRMRGRVSLAREKLKELEEDAMARPYSVALLDLAEARGDVPFRAVVSQLSRARTDDDAELLAKVALVEALSRSGAHDRAQTQYDELAADPGDLPADLLAELSAFVARSRTFVPAPETASKQEEPRPAEPQTAQVAHAASTASTSENEAREVTAPASKEEAQKETAVGSRTQTARPVSPEIQGLVTRADALWSGGDQAAAVTLYQEVLRAVGKQHYLGQRASARIAQAEREKAGKP